MIIKTRTAQTESVLPIFTLLSYLQQVLHSWRHISPATVQLNHVTQSKRASIVKIRRGQSYVSEWWNLECTWTLRGQAYLQLKESVGAAVEFQKILDHRGYAPFPPLYPLAQLGLARATQSQKAYDDFQVLWKDADAELPVLLAARKEAKQK